MHAITLWQPWASLVPEGIKTIETRSWACPEWLIGERIAIHAAARKPPAGLRLGPQDPVVAQEFLVSRDGGHLLDLCNEEVIPLYRGVIVATATLAACVPMKHTTEPRNGDCLVVSPSGLILHPDVRRLEAGRDVSDQRPYGDFRPGRWAWILDDIAPTTERCPACDGTGSGGPFAYSDDPYYLPPSMGGVCSICGGQGVCDPIPWRGRQRVWRWEP